MGPQLDDHNHGWVHEKSLSLDYVESSRKKNATRDHLPY